MEPTTDVTCYLVAKGYPEIWDELMAQDDPVCHHLPALFHDPELRYFVSESTDKDAVLNEETLLEQIKLGIVGTSLALSPQVANQALTDWGAACVRVVLSIVAQVNMSGMIYSPFVLSFKHSLALTLSHYMNYTNPRQAQTQAFEYLNIPSTQFPGFEQNFETFKPETVH